MGESSQIPSLRQTITKKDVFLFSERMRIEELLVAMTRELILRGTVKTLYPVNVLHLLNTMGAYGEIAKGVLLLHAEDVSYCNHLGLSIGNLKYPLTFSQNTHEIHTVVLLSTPDKLSHLRILKNLSQLFRDAGVLLHGSPVFVRRRILQIPEKKLKIIAIGGFFHRFGSEN